MFVTTRDFRANQSKYIGKARNGEEVVLYSRCGSVKLVPYDDDNDSVSPALQKKIDAARKAFREGKCVTCKTAKESIAYFRSL
mgnify:CR=1 FL=1